MEYIKRFEYPQGATGGPFWPAAERPEGRTRQLAERRAEDELADYNK